MKVKTSELTGPALDYAVARCEGVECDELHSPIWFAEDGPYAERVSYTPSTNWSQGGPLIEREGIDLNFSNYDGTSGEMWDAACEADKIFGGPTALVAAMRCYVSSRLGDEVDIPEELQ